MAIPLARRWRRAAGCSAGPAVLPRRGGGRLPRRGRRCSGAGDRGPLVAGGPQPGEWSLVYCTVGPGFSFEDFELLADHPASQRPTGATLELI